MKNIMNILKWLKNWECFELMKYNQNNDIKTINCYYGINLFYYNLSRNWKKNMTMKGKAFLIII